jgi:hypothetical protein
MRKVSNLIPYHYIIYCEDIKSQRKELYRIPIVVITAVTFNIVLCLITSQF